MKLKFIGKKLRLSALLSVLFFTSYGQLTLVDTGSCSSHVLYASITGTTPIGTGITTDDGYSGIFPIGFTFNFYGTGYTQCVIGSNGVINFTTTLAGAYCPWPIGAPLLGNASMRNAICGPWCDIYIPAGGTITYSTTGVAPNRKFAASWCATAMYSCTTQWTTTQIIIYETSNLIEVHTAHKTICAWNGGFAITGVQNAAGTDAVTAPGRDHPSVWSVVSPPEAWRFTPAGTTYTVSSIPFAPLPYATSTIYWYDSTTGAYLGTGPYLPVSPTAPTVYRAAALGCNDTTSAYILVNPPIDISFTSFTNPTICGKKDGTITLHGLPPAKPVIITYNKDGVPQTPISTIIASDSSVTIYNLGAGVYTSIDLLIDSCILNDVPVALINPPKYMPSFTHELRFGCSGDSVLVTNTTTPTGFYSYWIWGDGSALDSTGTWHLYNTHLATPTKYVASYNLGLIYNTTPYHDPACADTAWATINIDHQIQAVYTLDYDTVCLGTDINFINSSISNHMPVYAWDFGDGIKDNADNPVHNYKYAGRYHNTLVVTDSIGCQSSDDDWAEVISINAWTSILNDTDVCLRVPMPLYAYSEVEKDANTPVRYLWTQSPAGTNISDDTAAATFFSGIGTYSVKVTANTPAFTGFPVGCEASSEIVIRSHPPLTIINLTSSPQVVQLGKSIQLNAEGGDYYMWEPANGTCNNPNINNPIATPTDSVTNYIVYVMNKWGCKDTGEVKVYVDLGVDQFVPSAFTPNGDGKNDIFRIIKLRFQKLVEFRVFNRWGDCVFKTADAKIGWDGTVNGTPADMGTYVYEIIVALPDGLNKTYTGNVTLVR